MLTLMIDLKYIKYVKEYLDNCKVKSRKTTS